MVAPNDDERKRMRNSLRQAAIQRNVKTALILGAAASGAFFGMAGLAVTAASAMAVVSVVKWRQDRES